MCQKSTGKLTIDLFFHLHHCTNPGRRSRNDWASHLSQRFWCAAIIHNSRLHHRFLNWHPQHSVCTDVHSLCLNSKVLVLKANKQRPKNPKAYKVPRTTWQRGSVGRTGAVPKGRGWFSLSQHESTVLGACSGELTIYRRMHNAKATQ